VLVEHDILRATGDRRRAMVENADSLFPRVSDDMVHSIGQHKHEHSAKSLCDKQFDGDGLLEKVSLSIDQDETEFLVEMIGLSFHVAVKLVEDFCFVGDGDPHASMKRRTTTGCASGNRQDATHPGQAHQKATSIELPVRYRGAYSTPR